MKNVVIVGVGALGSHLVQLLRSTGASLKVIDFDKVEQKNVLSQFHGKTSVGKSKVVGLQQTMNFLFGYKVDGTSARLTKDNVEVLLGKADLVVDCLDNAASRKVVQEFVRASSVPCIHGALAPNGGFGRVVWDEGFVIDDETGMGGATCEDGAHLPFIAITSAYLARAVQVFLSSEGKNRIGFQVSPAGAMRI